VPRLHAVRSTVGPARGRERPAGRPSGLGAPRSPGAPAFGGEGRAGADLYMSPAGTTRCTWQWQRARRCGGAMRRGGDGLGGGTAVCMCFRIMSASSMPAAPRADAALTTRSHPCARRAGAGRVGQALGGCRKEVGSSSRGDASCRSPLPPPPFPVRTGQVSSLPSC
jgi:hypothetical protein